MKKILLFVAFIAISSFAFSQVTFEQTYDNGSYDVGTSVISLSDGYIMCGTTFDDANGDFDIFVTKVDLNGEVVWTNIYTDVGTDDDYATYINGTSDGNFVVTGNTTDPSTGDIDIFILKINSDGGELWTEIYDGGLGENDGANYIVEGDANSLIVCGYSYDGNYSDMWVLQTYSDGSFMWEDFYGLNGNDQATRIIETDDGGLAIIGQSYDDVNGDYDGVLIKLDNTATEEWTVYTTGTANEIYNDFIIDSYGDFLIVGGMEDEVNGDLDLFIQNISFDGSILYYSYTFDYLAGNDIASAVYTDGDGIFIAGTVEDFINGDLDAYIAQVDDATGNITGDVVYGNMFNDEFQDFDFTSDVGFICIGYQSINSADQTDVYLVKTDENGQVANNINLSQNSNIAIYPNPSSDFINITNSNMSNYQIIATDGKIVQQSELFSNQINIQNLVDGNYILKLYNNNEVISFKFIKE